METEIVLHLNGTCSSHLLFWLMKSGPLHNSFTAPRSGRFQGQCRRMILSTARISEGSGFGGPTVLMAAIDQVTEIQK